MAARTGSGSYAEGALRIHKLIGWDAQNAFFAAATEKDHERPELFREHAYSIFIPRALAPPAAKKPALDSAQRAVELEGAFDLENLFLADYGDWTLRIGDGKEMSPELKERTRALGTKYASLVPENGFFVYALYRVAMKWPDSSMAMQRFLEDSKEPGVKPWHLLARAWPPLREGVRRDGLNPPESHQQQLEQLIEALRALRREDPKFWIPLEFLNRISHPKDWNTPLPPELENGQLP